MPSLRPESRLASPPTSSVPPMPSSPPGRHQRRTRSNKSKAHGGKDSTQRPLSSFVGTDQETTISETSSSNLKAAPHQGSPKPDNTRRTVAFRKLGLMQDEKPKLLKIFCKHTSKFIRSAALGPDVEKEVWISVMEDFSETVRPGFFIKHADVKEKIIGICKARLYATKGRVSIRRKAQVGELGKWIDQCVRIWKFRGLMTNAAKFYHSLLETIGEGKLTRMFRHRLKGELPEDLGELALSAPVWKAIQEEISTLEREAVRGNHRPDPEETGSDWTDDSKDNAWMENMGDNPPLPSIEQDSWNDVSSTISADHLESASVEAKDSGVRDPSPDTLQKLHEHEQNTITWLKEEKRKRNGETIFIRDLVQRSLIQRDSFHALRTSDAPGTLRDSCPSAQLIERDGRNHEFNSSNCTPRIRPFSNFMDEQPLTTAISGQEAGKAINADLLPLTTRSEPQHSNAGTNANTEKITSLSKVLGQQDTATTVGLINPPVTLSKATARESISQRTSRDFNEVETRKHQTLLVPQQVPHRSSPAQRRTPNVIPSKNEIILPRFYGISSLGSSAMPRAEKTDMSTRKTLSHHIQQQESLFASFTSL
ncbi:hypothetical protein F4779DRAFT_265826 [Xylariaceae sp. FL0662B]|nr:hypothetical protein F4779DRAFT_265826 [Xylariaceae sp. FL0662B]